MESIPKPAGFSDSEWLERLQEINEADRHVCARIHEAVGLKLDSVFDLVNRLPTYPEVVPILLELLDEVRQDRIRDGIVRALAAPAAVGKAFDRLVAEFRSSAERNPGYGWVVANTLAEIAQADDAPIIVDLCTQTQFGSARQPLPLGLRKASEVAIADAAAELVQDADTRLATIKLIGTRRLTGLKSLIAPFACGPPGPQQRMAAQAMRKLGSRGQSAEGP